MKPIKIMGTSVIVPTVTVDIFNTSCSDTATDPADATATYKLNSSGIGNRTGSANWTWLTAGNNSDVEVRATLNSGALTSGTTGSWLNLSTTRTWTVTRTTVGTGSANVTIEIRRVIDGVLIDTATVTFSAIVSSAPSATVQLFDMNAEDTVSFPGSASASISFTSGGICNMSGDTLTPGDYTWLTSGSASAVDIRVVVSSGDTPGGSAVGTWLNLGTTRTWSLGVGGIDFKSTTATVQLRNASTLAILAGPKQFDLYAEVT